MNKKLSLIIAFFCFGFVAPLFAQNTYNDNLKPIDEIPDVEPDYDCNRKANMLVGRQFVKNKEIIEKNQSLPSNLKATLEDLKLIKENVRVVEKDGMITMDFSPQRLTIQLDEFNFIVKAYCG